MTTPERANRIRSLLAELTEQGQTGSTYHASLTAELSGLSPAYQGRAGSGPPAPPPLTTRRAGRAPCPDSPDT